MLDEASQDLGNIEAEERKPEVQSVEPPDPPRPALRTT